MQKAAVKWLMVANVIIGLNASGWTQDSDASRAEYLSSCAPCHGTDGKGDGPRSSKLRAKPADLTIFAKKNNGVFPVSAIYEAIDGRHAIESHRPVKCQFGVLDTHHHPFRQLKHASLGYTGRPTLRR